VSLAGIGTGRTRCYRGRVNVAIDGTGASAGARARLLAAGAGACTDVELAGLVLGNGADTPDVLARAERVLAAAGGLARIDRLDRAARDVLGRAWRRRLAALRAGLELGRRASAAPLDPGTPLRDAAAVYGHFRGRLPQLEREVFYVLLLDGKNRVQTEVRVSEGSLTAALVHPREVFAPAIRQGAAALILVHNHPSGDPTPSAEDAAITQRLRQVGELVGIRVLDHVVIGHGRWASMAEEGRW
jgi:DNA repair protein RadC